jgi:phosphatidylinositol alpha-1,6-mannosyltransferase
MTTSQKTLLITLDFPPLTGGVAEYYFNRVKKMNEKEIVVLADDLRDPSASRLPSASLGINFCYRKRFLRSYTYPHWLPIIKHIYYIAKKEKVKMLWVGQVLPVGTAVWFASKILRLPYKITCHGNDLLRAKNNKRKFCIAKKILKDAELVEANTKFTKDILINDFNVLENKIEIVYPENTLRKEMVDEKKVDELRQKYNLDNKKVLLTVARIVESKGIDTIIRVLPKVLESIPNLVYIIVGDGGYKSRLINIAPSPYGVYPPLAESGRGEVIANKKVIFVGSVAHYDLPNYYALADAFILTPHSSYPPINKGRKKEGSFDTESFGIVYLEAKEFDLPIIAGDVGGAREALANYGKGFFVDSENGVEISNKIIEVIKK